MPQFGGKPVKKTKKTSSDSKRHFTVVMGNKEHGLYVSSTPSSAAKKAVTKLCAANKSKKVEFYIREITQGSKKKTYGTYEGYIEKLKEPIELKGRVIKYKPVAKLSGKKGAKKGGMRGGENEFEIKIISKENAEKNYKNINYNRNFGGIVITDKSDNKKYFFDKGKHGYARILYYEYTVKSFLDESSEPLSFTIKDSKNLELALQEFRRVLKKQCTYYPD